ncbi:MAG: histidine--tRNA ligase [Endomicrobium sp.]|jgi:histidyl-tRNA synthetase|nr:histidine--tRNA ligase [Endomicrobium sp.]
MNYKSPRGTHDVFGKTVLWLNLLEQKAKEIFIRHGFEEVRTPIFEEATLFTRSIGQTTDIVEKEMYIFEDRKKRKLALRPEGTASLARAFIEHRMDTLSPACKFFYLGEMFRYERPQAGRYRQFRQIGAEIYANSSPAADAEIIILAQEILFSLGIDKINIHINSLGCEKCRPLFRETLIKYFSFVKNLCKDCLRRLKKNPLRLFDCKVDSCKFTGVPEMLGYLCCDCKDNFYIVQLLLKKANCNFTVNGKLVRGLDYYTKTVFEVRSDAVGPQDTLVAGGRYDNLVKEIGGQNTPAVGFAIGVERALFAAQSVGFFDNLKNPEKFFLAITDQELFSEAFAFAVKATRYGINGNKDISVFGPINGKSLTNQLKFADKIQVSKTIIFAKAEFENGEVLIKNMKDKTQSKVELNKL